MRKTPTSVKEAAERLRKLRNSVAAFYADPMTTTCGCCEDLQEGFDREERMLLGYIVNNAKGAVREQAIEECEKFFP